MDGSQRQGGVLIDAPRLDYQLGLRGISRRRLCELSGIPEPTISRACHGRPIRETTLRRLTAALLGVPLLAGADLVLAEPDKKAPAEVSTSSAGIADRRSVHDHPATRRP